MILQSPILSLPGRLYRYAQGVLGLRPDDVLLASFPRSGNTWLRFFFCNLISLQEMNGRTIDFATLDGTMPELGADNLLRPWPWKTLPRIVKTHRRFWSPLFADHRSLLVVRDPRDVMVSYHRYLSAKTRRGFEGSLQELIRHDRFGLEAWFRHYDSWRERATTEVRFEDLREGGLAPFRRLLEACDLALPLELITRAVERSGFERVQTVERDHGPSKPGYFKPGTMFARQGRSGQGGGLFRDEDVELYEKLKTRYGVEIY